ncbi:competence protein ComK [Salinicoccus sp. HZC-1]|uniref:competence protein ComK n=1 Tax=Salinicoccus sp. HZC-1 TaxID=3385497 RepID=UPI00398B00A2
MFSENPLNPGIYYIEPVQHPEFLCHMVYQNGRTIPSAKPSETLIDTLLLHTYGTTIKARRTQLKKAHNIHKLGPIIIDERLQFVLFPITVSRQKNAFWVNLHHVLEFTGDGPDATIIHFNDGSQRSVQADFTFCEKQFTKALRVMDRSLKIKAQSAMYITQKSAYSWTMNNHYI